MLLGVYGIVPAYDTYFVNAIKRQGFKNTNISEKLNSANAIYTVGKGDGIYLDLLYIAMSIKPLYHSSLIQTLYLKSLKPFCTASFYLKIFQSTPLRNKF